MTLKELISELNVKKSNVSEDTFIAGISEKSSACKKDYLFIAIKGTKSDGNDYIDKALSNGAVCVITEKEPSGDVPYILTDNARAALSLVWQAWYGYPAKSLKLIGITGTNGKTTTAFMLKSILDRAGKKTGLIGTVNYIASDERSVESQLTTPDPETMQKLLLQMKQNKKEYVVCEVSSHSLALDKLYGLNFEIGLFTNLSKDHLDFHGDMDEYFAAKKKLFSMCKKAVINIDNMYGKRLASEVECDKVTYSATSNDSDVCAKNIRLLEDRVEFEFLTDTIYRISCRALGIFNVYNSLAAAACAYSLGMSKEDITGGIREMGTVIGRMERIETGKDFSVIIDFAHTPAALSEVLGALRNQTKGRLVCLFGCGGDRDRSKRSDMGRTAAQKSDYVIITSDNPRSENPIDIIEQILSGVVSVSEIKNNYTVIEDREKAIKFAIDMAKKDDVILLAGKGHENYIEDASGKHPFCEKEIVKKALMNKI